MRKSKFCFLLHLKNIKCMRNTIPNAQIFCSIKLPVLLTSIFSRQFHFHHAVFNNYSDKIKVNKKNKKKKVLI